MTALDVAAVHDYQEVYEELQKYSHHTEKTKVWYCVVKSYMSENHTVYM